MGKKTPRVLDLGDWKKKPLGFGTLVMGKKNPRVWDPKFCQKNEIKN
jgi:hypothetical protein